jgi:hypothetical protein
MFAELMGKNHVDRFNATRDLFYLFIFGSSGI